MRLRELEVLRFDLIPAFPPPEPEEEGDMIVDASSMRPGAKLISLPQATQH